MSLGYDIFVELPNYMFELVKIGVIGIVCLAVYVELNLLMKMDYAQELFKRLAERFKK